METMAHILVIDDDQAICDLLRQILEREGFEVSVARDGATGIDLYRERPADVVITDIIMPGREGIETTRELKSIDPNAKIIAISGGGRVGPADFLSMARKLGADRTFAKPFDRHSLVHAVYELMGGDRGSGP